MTKATIQYPFPLHQIQIHPEMNIAYTDEGTGDTTLLFIHGLANYAPVWQYQLSELKKSYRCIALDLPGSGYSSHGDYPYTMFFYAESVARFIERLELKDVVLVGHSMGGQIGIIAALRYPYLLQKMVLVGSAGLEYFAQHEVLLMQGMLNMGTLFYTDEFHLESAIEQSFFKTHPQCKAIIHDLKQLMKPYPTRQWRNMCLKSIHAMLNEQVHAFLPNLQMPVHIVFGANDALIPNSLIHLGETPNSIGQKAVGLIPHSSYSIIANAGHFVQIEKPMEVNGILASFVNDVKVLA